MQASLLSPVEADHLLVVQQEPGVEVLVLCVVIADEHGVAGHHHEVAEAAERRPSGDIQVTAARPVLLPFRVPDSSLRQKHDRHPNSCWKTSILLRSSCAVGCWEHQACWRTLPIMASVLRMAIAAIATQTQCRKVLTCFRLRRLLLLWARPLCTLCSGSSLEEFIHLDGSNLSHASYALTSGTGYGDVWWSLREWVVHQNAGAGLAAPRLNARSEIERNCLSC